MCRSRVITIHFVDNGQDFLQWDIAPGGEVIDCRPFQASVWVGCRIVSSLDTLKAGDHPLVESKYCDTPRHLIHAIEGVTRDAIPQA